MAISDDPLDFDAFCDLFVNLGALSPPAELHGLLTGQLSAGMRFTPLQWLQKAREFMDIQQAIDEQQTQQLQALYQETLEQLEDPHHIFYPLLPADDDEFRIRLTALGQWCSGFLSGFALVEIVREHEFSDIVTDALKDIAAIAQVSIEDDDLDEEDEEDYSNVVEYVRLAVINIFLEQGRNSYVEASEQESSLSMTPQSLFGGSGKLH